jgi:hypothetical protein
VGPISASDSHFGTGLLQRRPSLGGRQSLRSTSSTRRTSTTQLVPIPRRRVSVKVAQTLRYGLPADPVQAKRLGPVQAPKAEYRATAASVSHRIPWRTLQMPGTGCPALASGASANQRRIHAVIATVVVRSLRSA